jgi:hypothetical protein
MMALGLTGCSTLSRGSHQTVTFKSDAPDATVYVGKKTLPLPATVELSRKETYTVLMTAPGRQAVQFEMKPKFDGISLGNLIYPGGSIGLLTDFLTGSDKKFATVKEVPLPPANGEAAGEPTLVLLHHHEGQLLTRQEIRALEAREEAASAGERVEPTTDESPRSGG